MATYYAQRASAGLIVTEGTHPSPVGQGYMDTPGLHSAGQVAAWRTVTDAVHREGGVIFAQLMHAGRISDTSLLPDALPAGDSLPQLLERLGARFGSAQLLQWQPQADHRPERTQSWQALPDATQLIATNPYAKRLSGKNQPQDPAFLPTWLLATPQRLALRQGSPLCPDPLTLLAGPQRLETGWWVEPSATGAQDGAAPALRDYYVARSAVSGLLWIYRERLDQPQAGAHQSPRWYLHGVFA
jgi:hypothetical protein